MTSVASRVVGEQAVVLHCRPYRESSVIVSMFTRHYGRVAGVARGARKRLMGQSLRTLGTVTVSWTGGPLVTLTTIEAVTHPWLRGNDLAAAFYALELVMRLTGEHDSHPRIYVALTWLIESLENGRLPTDVVLRSFEKLILEELGYGLDFFRDASSGEAIRAQHAYRFELDQGFVMTEPADGVATFSGRSLLDIGAENFATADARRSAKRIFRRALAVHLGPRPLVSRRMILRGNP